MGEASRCLLPPFPRTCPSPCPFCPQLEPSTSLLPAASLMKCKKCPETGDAAFCPSAMFKGRSPEHWDLHCRSSCCSSRMSWHLFPSCPFSGQRWGVEEPTGGRRVDVPCMTCGCSCNAPGPFPLELDCSLPTPQILLPHWVLHLLELWLTLACECVIALRPVELPL